MSADLAVTIGFQLLICGFLILLDQVNVMSMEILVMAFVFSLWDWVTYFIGLG